MSSAARTTPGMVMKRTTLTTRDFQCNDHPLALIPSVLEIVGSSHYLQSGFVECLVTRDVTAPKPRYSLTFQSSQASRSASSRPAIVAEKQSSVGGHYQLFDMSRAGPAEAVLSKKAGHYIGKLREDFRGLPTVRLPTLPIVRKKRSPPRSIKSYSLYSAKEEKEKLGIFCYDDPSLLSHWINGKTPRKLLTVLATSSCSIGRHSSAFESCALPNDWPRRTGIVHFDTEYCYSDDISCCNDDASNNAELHVFNSKQPFFGAGEHRLNFGGRVKIASAKNFQLENAEGEIVLQFGRVSDHRFHLDFRHPFSAVTAFSAALTQFDV